MSNDLKLCKQNIFENLRVFWKNDCLALNRSLRIRITYSFIQIYNAYFYILTYNFLFNIILNNRMFIKKQIIQFIILYALTKLM